MSSSTSSSHHRKVSQEELSDSWVTCEVDTDGENSEILSKEMERLLRDAQRESGQSSLVSSPKGSKVGSLPNTPFNSLQSTPRGSGHVSPTEEPKEVPTSSFDSKKAVERGFIWNYESTPEIRPRKNVSYLRPQRKSLNLSFRRTPVMKTGVFSWDFLKIFIPSIIFSNIIGIGIGYYLAKRCNQSSTTAV